MDTTSFWRAEASCDTHAMAMFLIAHQQELLAASAPPEHDPLTRVSVLLYEGWRALRSGDFMQADRCFDAGIAITAARNFIFWYDYFKGKAMAAYLRGDLTEALSFFERLDQKNACDPETLVYYGNTLLRLGRARDARPLYLDAAKNGMEDVATRDFLLTLGSSIETGDAVFDHLLGAQPWSERLQVPPVHEIPACTLAETFKLPIFINCRDRVTCLQRLVTWLLDADYQNLYLLDNASTYPPLLAYYEHFQNDPRVTVVRLGQNLGYQALWASGILAELDVRTPYVYTDPDVLPIEDCPRGVVARLYQILCRYPGIDKVGLDIKTDDLPPGKDRERATQWRYRIEIEENLWYAPVDTTFALYAPVRYYVLAQALRTTGRLMVRHLPWYFDSAHLPADEAYYIAHANESSNYAKQIKEQDVEERP